MKTNLRQQARELFQDMILLRYVIDCPECGALVFARVWVMWPLSFSVEVISTSGNEPQKADCRVSSWVRNSTAASRHECKLYVQLCRIGGARSHEIPAAGTGNKLDFVNFRLQIFAYFNVIGNILEYKNATN